MANFQRLSFNLWFDTQAEDAARFYTGIFPDSKIGRISYYPEAGQEIHGQKPGSVMTIEFVLDGYEFLGLNGGPIFKFNEAISVIINCKDQAEIDYYWDKLSEKADPKYQQCGWIKDKFGVSWQVVPLALADMMSSGDQERSNRVMAALMRMKKLDLAALEQAYNG